MTKIIAEVGINHNGSLSIAKKLIDNAKSAGVDIVKFQTFVPEEVVIANLKLAPYQKKNLPLNKQQSMLNMISKYFLNFQDQKKLFNYCKKKKIQFLSSPFDKQSAEFLLKELKLKVIKIPSGEITNYPLLKYISKFNVKIILSTGMSRLDEIKNAINILKKGRKIKLKNICILHCHTDYPTKLSDCNLNSINFIRRHLNVKVGLSDHTNCNNAAFLAVAMGVEYIEKHITLNKNMKGPDHKASLETKDLIDLVRMVNKAKQILGTFHKEPTKNELKNIIFARKSIVASRPIKKGEMFSEENMTTKRPLLGKPASDWKEYVGKKAKKNFKNDEFIK
tara:strand:+ start:14893 stop:15900 length:1008 start_codon:yes stop_codon:yes gene_type:complete